jgi:predicted outer membrane repeat protein
MLFLLFFTTVYGATFTVDPSGNGDYTTIQSGISGVSDGDTLEVVAGTYVESLDLGGKDLDIVSLSGAFTTILAPVSGQVAVTWDQGEAGSLEGFTIQPILARALTISNSSPSIIDVDISGGGTLGTIDGGAIAISGGSPSLETVSITGSMGRRGGAIYAYGQAAVSIIDLSIDSTSATYGGALYFDDVTVTADTVDIVDVLVDRSGGGAYIDDSDVTFSTLSINDTIGSDTWGVGLYIRDRSNVSVATGTISGNVATNYISGYYGGGIFVEGSSSLNLSDVELSDNTAYAGGGLAVDDYSTATLSNVTFDANEADDRGGGLDVASTSSVSCSSCEFTDNLATDGGAVEVRGSSSFVDVDGAYSGNEASDDGGAVHVTVASATFSGSAFTGNEAAAAGGAIYAYTATTPLQISNTSFSSNTATSDDGGAIAAIRLTELDISNSSFDSNASVYGHGGAIRFAPAFNTHDLTIDASSFEDNGSGGDGGAVSVLKGDEIVFMDLEMIRNTADADGGAISIDRAVQTTAERLLLHGNVAADSGGAWYERDTSSPGSLTNLLLVENEADEGGALYFEGVNDTYVVNNTMVGNDASSSGAHLFVSTGTVRFINNVFAWGQDGGGIYGDSTAAGGSDIYYNDAHANSGGEYVGSFTSQTGLSGNIEVDPALKDYTIDGDESNDDLHLELTSPSVDAGHPAIFDVDGTVSDIGAYGGPGADVQDLDGDGYFDHVDCDDSDASIYPGAVEIPYDGIDQDCDGADERDVDDDGFEDVGVGGADCDDTDADINPDASEIWYDGVDQNCDGGSDFDQDGDTYDSSVFGGDDCNDFDASVNIAATELWYDGIDQDCSGGSDFDADLDGYDTATFGGSDCNDSNPSVHPGATEIPYDGLDQDCVDGDQTDLDEDGFDSTIVGGLDCNDNDPTAFPGAVEIPYDGIDSNCDGLSDYDADGDAFDASAFGGTDCDDSDALIHPAAPEVWYDGVDQDCKGDDDFDKDGDFFKSDAFGGNDCDDDDPTAHPGSWETWYDGVDQDCAGDDDFDRDKDGYRVDVDCDDRRPEAHPDAEELPNGLDDDCDGFAETYDQDRDGLSDWDEDQIGSNKRVADTDGDGLVDGAEVTDPAFPQDSDLDGLIDVLDDDDDGDGIPTETELRADPDKNQISDLDVDGDGVFNYLDVDSDGDGYLDIDEGLKDEDLDGIEDYIDYTGDWGGGGCSGGPNWFALIFIGALFRSRRKSLALVAFWPTIALGDGFNTHGFELLGTTGDVQGYSRMAYPQSGAKGDWDVSVVTDYAVRPLVEVLQGDTEAIILGLTSANIAISTSVIPRTRIEIVAPVHPLGLARDGSFFAMGDVRLGAVVPAIAADGRRIGVALAPSVWLPTGDSEHFVGNPGFGWGGVITVAQEMGRVGWIANIGARVGRADPSRNVEAGSGALLGVGAHYFATDGIAFLWEATVQGGTGWSEFPVETLASTRFRLPGGLWATAGVGAGLNDDPGTSAMRAVVGLGWNKRKEEREEQFQGWLADPNADRDGDGFVDVEDACPDQPETVDGFTDEDGCPELDGDGDGVAFERDLCPREAIYPEQDPRYSDGCPKLAELAGERITVADPVFFEEGSNRVLEGAQAVLEAIYNELVDHPEVVHLLVEGHTNNTGSSLYNYGLANRRAEAVVGWLVKRGVDRNRLIHKGYGFDRPLLPHDHPDANEVNRRVVFTVMKVEAMKVAPAELLDEPVAPAELLDEPVAPAELLDEPVAPAELLDEPVAPAELLDEPVAPAELLEIEDSTDSIEKGESEEEG